MEILEHMKTLKGKGDESNQQNKPPDAKVGDTIILCSFLLILFDPEIIRADLLGEKKSGDI